MLLGAIIVFFHLLKLKRKRTVVPSILLWKRALEEIEANAPFKKLRRSLLLILQLMALAALVFALGRPLIATGALASASAIIVIDSTASMSARDEDGGSRMDRARQLAREMVESLRGGGRAAIIESSSRVTVRSPLTSDRAALVSAIADIQETDAPGNLTDAVRLAGEIAKSERDASVIVISDGAGSPVAGSTAPTGHIAEARDFSREVPIRFVRVGRRSDNVAIIALNWRQLSGSGRRELFASVADFADRDRSVGAELRIDGKLIDARTMELAASGRSALVFDSLPDEGGLAELRLDVDDDLAADNIAYAFLPVARRLRVGVISNNSFLLEALAANPDISVSRISSGSRNSEFDCIVSESAGVESSQPLLLINPPDSAGLWRATGQREHPEITSVERSHPVNGFLSYTDLHIESVVRREVASWLKPILTAENDPLIWAGDDGHRRVVLIAFDLARSDLPLKVEFPILLANSAAWLTGRDSPSSERAVRTGQPVMIHTSAASARVTTPAGDTREIGARNGSVVFADALRAGAYKVAGAAPFAASLLSESESNAAPRDWTIARAGEANGRPEIFHSEREAWRWIALVALVVLTIEWWAYHKRIA